MNKKTIAETLADDSKEWIQLILAHQAICCSF